MTRQPTTPPPTDAAELPVVEELDALERDLEGAITRSEFGRRDGLLGKSRDALRRLRAALAEREQRCPNHLRQADAPLCAECMQHAYETGAYL